MLLIIQALLLILAALGQDHRAAGGGLKLDMALNSVDDQYKGCTSKMAYLVKTKYLMKEINTSPQFKIGWQVGEKFVKFTHDAIKILKRKQYGCRLTYRGTGVEFNKYVLNKEVRFGSFASSSLDRNIARAFGSKSCFEIHTCEGANVAKYSKYPHEKEVLIPPYEKFKVTSVRTRKHQPHLWCETVFTLKSTGTISNLNCGLFKKPY